MQLYLVLESKSVPSTIITSQLDYASAAWCCDHLVLSFGWMLQAGALRHRIDLGS